MRVLIADDDVDTLRLVEHSMTKWGHQVIAVDDGAKALKVLQSKNTPLLAILDWNMPKLEGLEVIRRIRAEQNENYVYSILLTGKSEKKDILHGLNAGADDYISKPFDRDELHARVRAGERTIELEQKLVEQYKALQEVNRKLSVANNRLQNDFETAAKFQQSLLPTKFPQIPGIILDWFYQPCEELGGDMLNIFRLDHEHIGLYLLDVSGHGVAASFLTGTVSRLLMPAGEQSSLVRRMDENSQNYQPALPYQVLTQLNQKFYFDQDTDHYFTIIYGILNTTTRELRFAAAGHPGPVRTNPGGQPALVEVCSLPIGFATDARYEDNTVSLQRGDRLYFFSDGIIEVANNTKTLFGSKRLRNVLQKQCEAPLNQALASAVKTVEKWGGGDFDDDISIIAIEITA